MEFDEIVVKESPGLCRCCLSEGCYKDMGTEYTWMNENEVYADMLLECFDIGISQHNEGPNGPNRLICEVCITRLRDACNFKKQVLDSEKKFVDMVGRGEFRSKVLIYQPQMKVEANEVAEVLDNADVEYLEDIDFEDEDDLPLKHEASSSDITATALAAPKRGRPRKAKPDKKKAKLEAPKASKSLVKDENGPAKALNASEVRRTNLQIIFNNTTLIPFKWRGKYLCFYCGDDVTDCNELRRHTIEHGDCNDTDRAIRLVKSGDVEVKIDVSHITCKICDKSFVIFDDILNHLMNDHMLPYNKNVPLFLTTYRLVDLKCVFCDNSYNYFHKLVSHVNDTHPVNDLCCLVCNQKFNKKNDLDTHTRNRHRVKYFCNKCTMSFNSSAALHKHKSNSHGSHCNICFEAFPTDQSRVNHIKKVHFDNDLLQCGFCLKNLTTKIAFLNHAAKCNFKGTEDIKPIARDTKPTVVQIRNNITCIINMSTAIPFKFYMNNFRCFYCVKDFSECDDLKAHTVTEHPVCDVKLKCLQLRNRQAGIRVKVDVSALSCKVCYEPMQDLEHLIDHLIVKHKASYDKTVDHHFEPFKLIKDNFPCPFCVEAYRYFCTLLRHISETHSENRAICSYCGVTFRTESNLRFHISLKHNTPSHKCSVCDSSFPTKRHLREHAGSAHGSKVAKCSECSEKFKSPYAVQRHKIDVHGIGHKCSYCGRMFPKKSFMVDHIRRSHLKEKNVECPVCFQRFFNKYMVTRHMVMHVGERNFHCDICGKKFLWKKNLIGHMATHLKNNPAQT